MQFEHDDTVRTILRRARLLKIDDSGSQQKADLAGLKNEQMQKIVRILPHGFSSHPPKDSEAVILQLGGRSDRTLVFGGEHKDKRFKNLEEGAAVLYDADGKFLRLRKDDTVLDAGNKPVEIKNATTIKVQGATDLVIGVNGRWIRIRPGRVDLGIESPTGEAEHGVETSGGTSTKVFSVV